MGKAYRLPSATDRLRKQQIAIRNLQAENRNRNTPKPVAATAFAGVSAAGNTGGGTGNFLSLSGGTMMGNIGFDPDLILVSNGRVALDPNSSDSSSSTNILVTGQGTPDDIRFIDGAEKNGQLLLYQGTNQQIQNLLNAISFLITNIVGTGTTNIVTVTVSSTTGLSDGDNVDVSLTTNFNKQDAIVANLTSTTFTYDLGETGSSTAETTGTVQTGNIYTNNGNTITLDGTLSLLGAPRIPLIFDSSIFAGGGWRPADSVGGSGGVSFPITPTVSVRGTVTTTQDIDLSAVTAHSTSMTLGANISITFSNEPATGTQIEWEIQITQDGTGGRVITWPAAVVNPPTLDTTANSIVVVVFRTNDGGTTVRVANTVTTTGTGDVSLWANFTAVSDIDYGTFDGINIDRLLFSQTAGSSLTAAATGITSNASSSMLFNVPSNTLYSFRSNALSILTLDNTSTNLFLGLFARDDEIPILQLTRIDSTPTVGTEIGRTTFVGVDSTGSTLEEYARITVDSEDLTIGSVDGSMHLQVDKNSLTTAFLSINNSNDNKVSIWKNLFMQTGIDIELNGNDIIFDSTGTNLINADTAGLDLRANGSGDTIQMHSDGAIHTFSSTSLQLGVTAELDLFTRAVGITPSTATFLSDGTISYNSTANEFRFRENGATITLGGGSGANTALSNLITTSINKDLLPNVAGTFNLGSAALRWGNCFFGRIVFPTNTSPIAADVNIVRNANDMQYNVPTGSTFNWTFQSGSTQMELSSTELRLPGVNLDMENNSITDANQIQVTGTSGDTIRGFLSGASGFFDISANENGGTIRMFAKTSGGANNNMVDIDGNAGIVGFGQGAVGFGSETNRPTISRAGNDLNYNVISAAEINLQVGATNILNITSSDVNVNKDLDMNNNITVDWASTQSTVGSAGGASTLPATPTGYVIIKVNGTERVIPFYAKS